MPIPRGRQTCVAWLYIVDDVDAAAVKLKKLGGTVHIEPQTVPGIIRFAVVPTTRAWALRRPRAGKGDHAEFRRTTPGNRRLARVYATNGRARFGSMESMFGWTKAEQLDMGEMGTYQLFAQAAHGGRMMTKPPGHCASVLGLLLQCFCIDAAANRFKAAAHEPDGPHEVPGGQWILQCKTPRRVLRVVSRKR